MLSEVLNLTRSIQMEVGKPPTGNRTLSDRDVKVIITRFEHLAKTWFQFVEWAEVHVDFDFAKWTMLGRLADSLRKLYTNTPLNIYFSDELKEQMLQKQERIIEKAEEGMPF